MQIQKTDRFLPDQVPGQNIADQVTDFLILNFDQILDRIDANVKTRSKYKTDAKLFIDFVSHQGLHLNTFRDYKKHLQGLTCFSTKTKRHKLISAKRLLQELHTHYKLLTVDLTAGTKNFQISAEHTKDGLSADQVKSVKKIILQEADALKRSRLLALFQLLALQGLRQFEVCQMTVEDLQLPDRIALIKGKGRDDKERIDLHPDTVKALEDYLKQSGKRSGYLFTSISPASKGEGSPLTERAVRKLFTDQHNGLFIRAGIAAGKSVHGLRHYFVTKLLEVTSGDLLTVQKFSRHRSLQSIRFYDDRKRKQELLPAYYAAFNI